MDSPALSLAAQLALEAQLRQVEGCDDVVGLRGLCKCLLGAIAVQRGMTLGAMGLEPGQAGADLGMGVPPGCGGQP
jgi:hypothetical protein